MYRGESIICIDMYPRGHFLRNVYGIAQYKWFSGLAVDLAPRDKYSFKDIEDINWDFGGRAVNFLKPFFDNHLYVEKGNLYGIGDLKYVEPILGLVESSMEKMIDDLKELGYVSEEEVRLGVCMLNSEEMIRYREFGQGEALVLHGPGTIAVNMTLVDELGVNHPAIRRGITHEPKHHVVSEVLPPTWNLHGSLLVPADYHDIVAHEALGGLNDPTDWADVPKDLRVDFSNIETLGFWKWYSQESSRLGYSQIGYFQNPVSRAFHSEYALGEGRNTAYWVQRITKVPGERLELSRL